MVDIQSSSDAYYSATHSSSVVLKSNQCKNWRTQTKYKTIDQQVRVTPNMHSTSGLWQTHSLYMCYRAAWTHARCSCAPAQRLSQAPMQRACNTVSYIPQMLRTLGVRTLRDKQILFIKSLSRLWYIKSTDFQTEGKALYVMRQLLKCSSFKKEESLLTVSVVLMHASTNHYSGYWDWVISCSSPQILLSPLSWLNSKHFCRNWNYDWEAITGCFSQSVFCTWLMQGL